MYQHLTNIVAILVLTVITGLGDSQGFLHAAKIWAKGQIVWGELTKSALGFGVGIVAYWFVIKFLNQVGIVSPEIQTVGWFGVTILVVALINGEVFNWPTIDKLVSLVVLLGIGWLIFHAKA